MSATHPSLVAGKQITKAVSLLKPLSSGGMGAVWLADHLSLKTQVVVKFMLGTLDQSETARTRFSREAAAAAQVKSPHVVQMLDHGVSDEGVPFIIMEHLEGHDLGDEIEKHGPVEPAKVVAIVTQVAKALSKVHAAGLLHRDIKPDNIFLVSGEEDVFVKLLDFGIAKSSSVDQGDGSLDGETKTGQVVGTPFYMSPEQVTAQKNIDHRSDLWSLGVVAYEALTGKRPYDGPSFGALAVKIAAGNPPRITDANPALPPTVDAWFAKACAREPADRFSSAKEMADAFRAAFDGVMSIPAASGGSGERSQPAVPAARPGSGDAARPSANGEGESRPSVLGLAATALDDSAASRSDRAALGRSETGVSVADGVRPKPSGSKVVYFGGAIALSGLTAFAVVTTYRSSPVAGGGESSVSTVSAAAPTTTSEASAQASASAAPSTATVASAGPAAASVSSAVASVSAAAPDARAPASSPARTGATTPRHGGHAGASGAGTAKASAEASAKPPATTKPADTAPDLF